MAPMSLSRGEQGSCLASSETNGQKVHRPSCHSHSSTLSLQHRPHRLGPTPVCPAAQKLRPMVQDGLGWPACTNHPLPSAMPGRMSQNHKYHEALHDGGSYVCLTVPLARPSNPPTRVVSLQQPAPVMLLEGSHTRPCGHGRPTTALAGLLGEPRGPHPHQLHRGRATQSGHAGSAMGTSTELSIPAA